MLTHNQEQFIYWVEEREKIRILKEMKDIKPWSDNPVMQRTYFCNIDREEDKVTKALRGMYSRDIPLYPAIPNWIMARMVNKPSSLMNMRWPWNKFDHENWHRVMSQKGSWGSAYIVSTNGRAMPKHDYIAGVLEQAWAHFGVASGATPYPTLSVAHKGIQALHGMGSFMSAQVIADLKNTKGHPLADAEDWWTWASHGPGSLRGLEWFHEYKVRPSNFTDALVSAREICYTEGYKGTLKDLCNQNLQNCFCEYDKFMRVTNNTGRSKRNYDGA